MPQELSTFSINLLNDDGSCGNLLSEALLYGV